MKFLGVTLASLGLVSAATVAKTVSYDDWKVYRVSVGSNAVKLENVMSKLQLELWKGKPATSDVVDLMVPPTAIRDFEASTADFETKIMHNNLGLSIANETTFSTYAAGAAPSATWFNSYHSIADHMQWISDLAAAYPNNAEVISAGKSVEGRDIKGIHIWGSGGKGSKRGVVWHGTVHAREWITTMVVEYTAYQLLTSTDSTTANFKNTYDFYIFPIVNPDGFAYTQATDRMWRKNRQTTPSASCVGRDINRNWPSHWDQRGGASTSPCAEDYKGPSAGDGVETKALKAHLDSIAAGKGVMLYMDIHSYSQLWMYPYGYTCSGAVPNAAKHASLTKGAIAAVKAVHGTTFTGGPICNTIYQVSGDSVDYAFEVAKANFSMTVELRDTGTYGFVLPAAQIVPSAEEMWAGLRYLVANM
ncbi:carboxypeptidase [Pyrenophora tritici-repentis]|uniref:Carboxypeptidase n=1 Tax=Pyrenophora tritici-repentis TaxID=45151 RepID=A0A2W1GS02_9PLEO|nr:Carboxypeptidase A1 [Pyrenophora tritici-repentis]KAF7453369.1 Carboxypeptidase A1 [Pyrenophora tritici-repentis]KAF7576433.1 carboxypeptidase [Pyrenophora tritici-repentis]KAG9387121.1 Carboxypeptidase A1 [Pyrenophora tritici-repentis]KAI0572355.1 Carboxypeptidase A1 [Pyrenophora tritici-repentis]